MARLATTGALSVGNTNANSINGLDGLGNVQTNITTKESTFMGGNPANRLAAGAKCMPNQAEKIIDGTTAGAAYRYNGTSTAWRQTALSEFRGAYTTVPSIGTPSYSGTGNYNSGYVTITVTPPADGPGTCSVWMTPAPASGETTWQTVNGLNQKRYTISRGTTYRVYVKDVYGCGANLEISLGNIAYTTP